MQSKRDEMREDKARIRREMLAMRRAMAPGEVASLSAAIAEQVWALPEIVRADTLLSYVDTKDNEVRTRPIILRALEEGKTVFVPVSEAAGTMRWSRLRSLGELVPGRYGILEPRAPECDASSDFDGVPCLVPGITFSRIGQRIGYGAGYFDRFLSECSAFSVGLAFENQVCGTLPCDNNDVSLDVVVTEAGVYRRE